MPALKACSWVGSGWEWELALEAPLVFRCLFCLPGELNAFFALGSGIPRATALVFEPEAGFPGRHCTCRSLCRVPQLHVPWLLPRGPVVDPLSSSSKSLSVWVAVGPVSVPPYTLFKLLPEAELLTNPVVYLS